MKLYIPQCVYLKITCVEYEQTTTSQMKALTFLLHIIPNSQVDGIIIFQMEKVEINWVLEY